MALTRAQIKAAISASITDALNRQNTAAVVRAVLNLLNDNFFNLEDDELSISHISGLQSALDDLQDAINTIDPYTEIGDVVGLQDALDAIQESIDSISPSKEYLLKFDEVDIDPDATIWRTKKIQILGVEYSGQIASVSYEVAADGSSYVPKATFAEVNTWIATNIANGNKYYIKVNRVAVSGAAGEAWVEITYKEIA